jgi:phage tail-like protein
VTLRLTSITAKAHPEGNRIDLSWENPEAAQFPGTRVMRRVGTFPVSPADGDLAADGVDLNSLADKNLKSEIVYYYALFPYRNAPPEYEIDRYNRVSTMATGPYNMAGQMYDLLPAIYHRYDTKFPLTVPPGMTPEDAQRGQLRRFLDLPGGQLDQFVSLIKTIPTLADVQNVDGALLPLLAEWIAWRTDHRLELDAQRNELRDAVSVYQTIGLIPSVEATVKRILGWESRAKEFVHNVARTNQPERMNIWVRRERAAGDWSHPIEPFSLGFAYDGRPSTMVDQAGTRWFFFHTLRNGRWDIWYKSLSSFVIATSLEATLNGESMTFALQQAFEAAGYPLSLNARITKNEDEWLIRDREHHQCYTILPGAGRLDVYVWAPSKRLTSGPRIDKHPSAVVKGDTLWVYWDSADANTQTHQLRYQSYRDGIWSAPQVFGEATVSRKRPFVVIDHTDHIWIFWLERQAAKWELKFLREENNAWNIPAAHTFPLDEEEDPVVQTDLFVFFQPGASAINGEPKIWVFWSRKVPTGAPKQSRWEIAYRFAENIDPDEFVAFHSWSSEFPIHLTVDTTDLPVNLDFVTSYVNRPPDWSQVFSMSKSSPDDQDREPALFLNPAGQMEFYWSSNRNQSSSIWRAFLRDTSIPAFSAVTEITEDAYSQRDPLPFIIDGVTRLSYHSNEPVGYVSEIYGATETVDLRYSGTTSVDTKNLAKIALRGTYDDFQTYSYDTGTKGKPTPLTWYARDTIGLYLTPDTDDTSKIQQNRTMIERILREFLPIQIRAVFIFEPAIYKELIYTTDFPSVFPQRVLGDLSFDGTVPEVVNGVGDAFTEVLMEEGG